MLGIRVKKNINSMFETLNIDYLIVNWCVLNNEAYLIDFKYIESSKTINFTAELNKNIWLFILQLPIKENDIFFLSSGNTTDDYHQNRLIDSLNLEAMCYNYNEFFNFMTSINNVKNYNLQSSVLVKFLNNINDKCSEIEEEMQKSDSESSDEVLIMSDYSENEVKANIDSSKITVNLNKHIPIEPTIITQKELNCLWEEDVDKDFDDTELLKELDTVDTELLKESDNVDTELLKESDTFVESDVEDLWGSDNENEFLSVTNNNIKCQKYLNKNAIIKKSTKIISEVKKNHKNVYEFASFSDTSRINMLINEVNTINNKYKSIQIDVYDDNIFDLNIKLSQFTGEDSKQITDFEIKLSNDPVLFPYYPPKISFNKLLKDNLDYLISELDYFKLINWNPTNSLEHTLLSIWKIINNNGQYNNDDIKSNDINIEAVTLLNELSVISQIKPLIFCQKNIKIDFVNIRNFENNNKNDKRNGIGYGSENRSVFDIKNYISSIDVKYIKIAETLKKLNIILENSSINVEQLKTSCILPLLSYFLRDIQLLEVNNNEKLYDELFNFANLIITNYPDLIPFNFNDHNLIVIFKSCKDVFDIYKQVNSNLTNIEKKMETLITLYNTISESLNIDSNSVKQISSLDNTLENNYIKYFKENGFKLVEKFHKGLYTPLDKEQNKYCSNIARIGKEMTSLKTNIPTNWSSSMFIRFNKENMSLIKAIIIGPNDTPYENGFFEFHIKLGESYPKNNPSCHFQTTSGGRFRFNPNLYNCGKVCLSLLGTWRGHESENWNQNTSSILQLLLSIQSLILCEEPYFNEPGYEKSYGTPNGISSSKNYSNNVKYHTIEIAIIEQINNPPEQFEQDVYAHFYFKRDEILKTFDKWTVENSSLAGLKSKLINALDKAQTKYLESQ